MVALQKTDSRVIGTSILPIILAACGGSSDVGKCYTSAALCANVGVSPSVPTPPVYATGLYKGLTSNGRSVTGIILDDNSFYAIYSGINNPSATGGAVQGTIRASAGSFTVTDAVDVNIEGLGTQVAGVSGTYGEKQFINGSIVYPATSQSVSFAANYSSDYEITPTLSAIAGNFVGSGNTVSGSERVTFTISSAGDLTGSGASGCKFSGTVKPRSSGNVYVMTIQLGAAPCGMPGSTLSGISYFDRTTNLDYTVTSIPGQASKLIAIATKQ